MPQLHRRPPGDGSAVTPRGITTAASGKINQAHQPTRSGATSSRRAGASASRRSHPVAVQINAGFRGQAVPAVDLHRVHFPTGRMPLEGVIRLLADQFGVPCAEDASTWRPVLAETERAFLDIAHMPLSGRGATHVRSAARRAPEPNAGAAGAGNANQFARESPLGACSVTAMRAAECSPLARAVTSRRRRERTVELHGYQQSARRCCLLTDAGAGGAPIARCHTLGLDLPGFDGESLVVE